MLCGRMGSMSCQLRLIKKKLKKKKKKKTMHVTI